MHLSPISFKLKRNGISIEVKFRDINVTLSSVTLLDFDFRVAFIVVSVAIAIVATTIAVSKQSKTFLGVAVRRR